MRYADFLSRTELSFEELLGLAHGTLIADPPAEFTRLPAPPMLMLDRVSLIERKGPRGRIVGERDVRIDDWFYQCHFVGDPVQPGCLGVDAVWQLVGLYCSAAGATGCGRALGCKEIDFVGQIRPYNRLVRYEVDIRRFSQRKAAGAALAVADARVLVDEEQVYTIKGARVGTFRGIAYADYPARSSRSVGGIMER